MTDEATKKTGKRTSQMVKLFCDEPLSLQAHGCGGGCPRSGGAGKTKTVVGYAFKTMVDSTCSGSGVNRSHLLCVHMGIHPFYWYHCTDLPV
ncbi:MAG: hypothetical protein SWH68_10815 [Thermodesulfobacteriota bacterium]|nr:hypothetical protein [Thermodesulfobacteriota bacterium]